MAKDYLAAAKVKPTDKLDHGVKGMKWGVTRSRRQLRAAAAKRAETEKAVAPVKKPPAGPETASQRYARLSAVAKAGGASSLETEDLAFFNSRTDAIAKVDRMFQQNPSWLKDTVNKVAKQAAQKAMQDLTNTAVNNYLVGPLTESLAGKAKTPAAAPKPKPEDDKMKMKAPLGFAPTKKK